MKFLETCREFIGIDSTSCNGTSELVELASQLCREAGLVVELQRERHEGADHANIVGRTNSLPREDELVLLTHLDTQDPVSSSLWSQTQENPFNATIYDGKIFGLGAADVKLDFLCKLEALSQVIKGGILPKDFKHPCAIVGTFGAHTGMTGVSKLLRQNMVLGHRVLVGEPTSLQLVNAGVGLAVVEISVPFSQQEKTYHENHDSIESSSTQSRMFTGKAAHSSEPDLGENAIVKMVDYLRRLPEGFVVMDMEGGVNYNSVPDSAILELDLVDSVSNSVITKVTKIFDVIRSLEWDFKNYSADKEQTHCPTLNVGRVRKMEEVLRFLGSCRLPPHVSQQVYESWMDRLRKACQEIGATFRISDYKRSFQTEADSNFVTGCQQELNDMGLDSNLNKISTTTEASLLAKKGFECLVFGPGQGVGNSHAPNEHISIDQLEKAIEFYRRVIERNCL